jgi:DNA-binding LacI/PurR family transcriptional regulator
MWKAVRAVQESGGTAGALPAPPRDLPAENEPPAQAGNLLWRKVHLRLKKDILSGRFGDSEVLPTYKELQSRYAVSFRTLKKIINELSGEEIIKPDGKRRIAQTLTTLNSNAKIVAIGCGWEDGKIWADYHNKNYFRIIESVCMQNGISSDLLVYFRKNDRLRIIHSITQRPYSLSANDGILGIVYIIANLEVDPAEVLKELLSVKKPIAVLDVIGYCANHLLPHENPFIRFFTTTTSLSPARHVAQYLLRLGHKHIAFISPFHKAQWSKIRYAACDAMYRDAGCTNGVTPLVLDRFAYQWDYIKKLETPESLQALISRYTQQDKLAHAEFFKKFGNFSYSISRYLTEWNCAIDDIYQKMTPLFQKALNDRRISAWLVANDFAAMMALDFLKEKKVSVPEELSVMAFDNTLDAMEYQLSTYDFNDNGIITMIIRYIISPSTIPAREREKIFEVDGTIVVRRSTARPRAMAVSL